MVDIEIVREWIVKADEDFEFARVNLEEDKPFYAQICFHFQQAAEKYLKALLTCLGIEFPKTHDLVVLFNRVGKESDLELEMEDIQPLNRYSLEARYPGDWDPIDMQEAMEAMEKARRIREAARNVLPEDVLHGET